MNSIDGKVRIVRAADATIICPLAWNDLPLEGVRAASIPVAGGVLVIDPQFPDREMGARLTDLDEAAWWLSGVFGESAALAVLETQVPLDRVVAVEWGAFSLPVRRLAFACWLYRWWPSERQRPAIPKLDSELLYAEIGTAAWQAEPCLPDEEFASAVLGQSSAAVCKVIPKLSNLTGPVREQAEHLVWTTARAIIEQGDPTETCWPALEALWQRRGHEEDEMARFRVELDADALDELLHHEPATDDLSQLALIAGGEYLGPPVQEYHSDVDWLQVNPRMVANRPGNARITVHEADAGRVRVHIEVLAGDQPSQSGLRARLYSIDAAPHLPVQIVSLSLESDIYCGECLIEFHDMIDTDVYHPSYINSPRFGPDPQSDRDYIQEILSERAASPLESALGPFACELIGASRA